MTAQVEGRPVAPAGRRSGRRPLVVMPAAVPWSGTTTTDQHVAMELRAYADVLYVDPPTSALTRWRDPAAVRAAAGDRRELVRPGLTVLRPRTNPLMERRIGTPVAMALARQSMRAAVRDLGSPPVHAVVLTSLSPLFGAVGERLRVFLATDDMVAGSKLVGIEDRSLARRAMSLARSADLVAAVSPALVDSLSRHGITATLMPNGVDAGHFRTAIDGPVDPEVARIDTGGEPLAGLVGVDGDRVDPATLEAVLDSGVHLLIVGPPQRSASPGRLQRLLARPEVHRAGPRTYGDLPGVLAAADVWLLPYGNSAVNRAGFPLGALEYLAAGRRVVATDLPAVRWLDTEHIAVADTPERFAYSVLRELSSELTAEESHRRSDFAAGHGWDARVAVLAEHMGLTTQNRRSPGAPAG